MTIASPSVVGLATAGCGSSILQFFSFFLTPPFAPFCDACLIEFIIYKSKKNEVKTTKDCIII